MFECININCTLYFTTLTIRFHFVKRWRIVHFTIIEWYISSHFDICFLYCLYSLWLCLVTQKYFSLEFLTFSSFHYEPISIKEKTKKEDPWRNVDSLPHYPIKEGGLINAIVHHLMSSDVFFSGVCRQFNISEVCRKVMFPTALLELVFGELSCFPIFFTLHFE